MSDWRLFARSGDSQRALAEQVKMHISQIRRDECGQSQPTLDAIRKLVKALSVSADTLLFAPNGFGIKQHLRIKAFYGTSANAVKTQIWIAIAV